MSGARLPCVLRATAPFVHVRVHGPHPEHLYAGFYPSADLRWWPAGRASEPTPAGTSTSTSTTTGTARRGAPRLVG
ncbi:hypothetical protein [Modestobacter sp. DSM 44400]|uniref:hypothetical protein n=1 Tax=Modestobacter sp. DSM 44400 TaxID=1550230 RepID=UPI00352AC143